MPRKIRELESDLKRAGFENRGGKGSHRNYVHDASGATVTIAGKGGDDAQRYQEKETREAIERAKAKG